MKGTVNRGNKPHVKIGLFTEGVWLLIIFLLPLYFNPFGHEAFYLAKALLFQFLVCILLGLALAQGLLESPDYRPRLDRSWFRRWFPILAVLLFGVIYVLSAVFSIQPHTSLWGNLADNNGLVMTLCWIIYFLVLAGKVTTKAQIYRIVYTLTWSASLAALVGIIQYFAPWIMPWFAFQGRAFSTAGNPLPLSAFLAMSIPMTAAMIYANRRSFIESRPQGKRAVALLLAGLALQVTCLCLAQYSLTWMLFTVGIIVFAALAGLYLKKRALLFGGIAAVLVIGLTASALLLPLLTGRTQPDVEASQPAANTMAGQVGLNTLSRRVLIWECATRVIVDSPEIPFDRNEFHQLRRVIGYGPDTFIVTSQLRYPAPFKSEETYNSMLLSQPENHYLFLAATVGLVGLFSYLLLIAVASGAGLMAARKIGDKAFLLLVCALLAGLAQYCAHILFNPNNITPDLVFWLCLGLLSAISGRRLYASGGENEQAAAQMKMTGAGTVKISLLRKIVAISMILIMIVAAVSITARPVIADIKLQSALNLWEKDKYAAVRALWEITKVAPDDAVYYGYFGHYVYQLAVLNTEIKEKNRLLDFSLSAYETANTIEPFLAYWNYQRGDVYTYRATLDKASEIKNALHHYETAAGLFPGNPVILNKWALSLILLGDFEEAAVKLKESRQNDPDWAQTGFLEGFLQSEMGDDGKAGIIIMQAAADNPANLRYFLNFSKQLALYGKANVLERSLAIYLDQHSESWMGWAMAGIAHYYAVNLPAAARDLLKCAEAAPAERKNIVGMIVMLFSGENTQFKPYADDIFRNLSSDIKWDIR